MNDALVNLFKESAGRRFSPSFDPEDVVLERLKQEMSPRCTSLDFKLLDRTLAVTTEAVDCARLREFQVGLNLLQAWRTKLRTFPLTYDVSLLVQTHVSAAGAYLHYKQLRHEDARVELRSAIAAASILHSKLGYEMLYYRRIHLLINHVKNDRRSGSIVRALARIRSLAEYLNGEKQAPCSGIWNRSSTLQQPEGLKLAIEQQVAAELLALAVYDKGVRYSHWANVFTRSRSTLQTGSAAPTLVAFVRMLDLHFAGSCPKFFAFLFERLAGPEGRVAYFWSAAYHLTCRSLSAVDDTATLEALEATNWNNGFARST